MTVKGKRTMATTPTTRPAITGALRSGSSSAEGDGIGCAFMMEGRGVSTFDGGKAGKEDVGHDKTISDIDKVLLVDGGEEAVVIVAIESEDVRDSEVDAIFRSGLRGNRLNRLVDFAI
jgi:hypothetical protein